MASMQRWDPFREMMSLREAMDSLFENALVNPAGAGQEQRGGWAMPLDVIENEDSLVIKASLPGINPEDLDVTVNGDVLTIRGEMKQEEERKGGRYVMQERRWGTFARSVTLPTQVKADAIQADFSNGVLTLTLPKSEEVKPRKIQIRAREQQKQIGQPETQTQTRSQPQTPPQSRS